MTKIGLGLAALGRPDYINIRENIPKDKSVSAYRENTFNVLDEAYRLGLRHFDVAASYGYGERFLLDWLKANDPSDVTVSTKWGYTYVANWNIGYTGKHEVKEHSLKKLNEQWQLSQQFMPWLNLYQIHSATLESGVLDNTEVHRRLFELKRKYDFKIGISTSGTNQSKIIEKAESIVVEGLSLIDTYQVTYNVLEQSARKTLQNLKLNNKTIIIKEALANGRVFPWYKKSRYTEILDVLKEQAKAFNVGIDAVAMRFVIDSVEPDMVLSGASNCQQLQSNMDCLKFQLPLKMLNKLYELNIDSKTYWTERSQLNWQ